MSGSLNKWTGIGNLGSDPETKSFQNGGKVCNFRIACTESWKNKDGEKQERTEWVSVAIFNEGIAGVAERYLRKGSKVYVEGKLQTRKWQDRDGSDRYTTEVVMNGFDGKLILLGDAGGGQGDRGASRGRDTESRSDRGGGKAQQRSAFDDLDDDVPFASCDPALDRRARQVL